MFEIRNWAIAGVLSLAAFPLLAEDKPAAPAEKPAASPEKPAGGKKEPAPVPMNDAEAAFAKLMTGADLVGYFTVEGRKGTPKEDRYTIAKAVKVKDGKWMIHARVKYGDVNVVVPVPVNMDWAGDTPVLSVTNLSIPLLGNGFDTRLLFDGDRYAGTWAHGKVGGHMWGRIERAKSEDIPAEKPEAAKDAPPTESSKPAK